VIYRHDPSSGATVSRRTAGRPGSIALTPDPDELIVAVEQRIERLKWSHDTSVTLITLENRDSKTRLNDGRCDAAGRFWVGSMDDPPSPVRRDGRLYCVDERQGARVADEDIGVANTLAFSPDQRVMYFADTTQGVVWSYDYDIETGRRQNRRVFLDFAELPGKPDGACTDETGCLWIACVYGWTLVRATPQGNIDRMIDLPVEKPSMPAFGGDKLDTLYLTSISTGGSRPAAPGQPLAGALLALDVGVGGLCEPMFGNRT
jgi:sugar lactone lactonase YvrE